MKEFLEHLERNLHSRHLIDGDRPVIVAVSGGADSMALLVGLNALGINCIAAHCNFHLRGEESNRDMRAVQSLCRSLGIDLYVKDFDVAQRQRQAGESVEMACRELRYQWFADLLDRQRAQAIAVAHHREDNVETFMLNLLRGSGITGLGGMRWRNGYIIRPLLDFSRVEIEAFLASEGIAYVDDSTNAQSIYTRNRLRLDVLPAIESHFPNALEGMLASISCLADNRRLYEGLIEEKRQKHISNGTINLRTLISQEPEPRMLLFELLRPMGFNMSQTDNILASATKSGLTFTAESSRGYADSAIRATTVLSLDRGVLHIRVLDTQKRELLPEETEVSLSRDILQPAHITITEHPVAQFRPERDPNTAYFDIDILSGNPTFALRHWRRGDKFQPYGMGAHKLLSDVFANAKYSLADKAEAWLLTRNGEILWVLGLRQSARFAIVPETRRYIEMRVAPQPPKGGAPKITDDR